MMWVTCYPCNVCVGTILKNTVTVFLSSIIYLCQAHAAHLVAWHTDPVFGLTYEND